MKLINAGTAFGPDIFFATIIRAYAQKNIIFPARIEACQDLKLIFKWSDTRGKGQYYILTFIYILTVLVIIDAATYRTIYLVYINYHYMCC
jgi:hypothetical protein